MEILVDDLEKIFDNSKDIAEEDRKTYLCVIKMLAYLFSYFICHMEDYIVKNTSLGKVRNLFI